MANRDLTAMAQEAMNQIARERGITTEQLQNEISAKFQTMARMLVSINTIDGVTFINHKYQDPKEEKNKIDRLPGTIKYLKYVVCNLYMRSMDVYKVDNDLLVDKDAMEMKDFSKLSSVLQVNLNRIIENTTEVNWKIESPNRSVYFEVIRNSPLCADEDNITMLIIEFIHDANICQIQQAVLVDHDIHIGDFTVGPFYIAKKEYQAVRYINKHGGSAWASSQRLLELAITATSTYLEDNDHDYSNFPNPVYRSAEIQVFSSIIKRAEDERWRSINIHLWHNVNFQEDNKFFHNLDHIKHLPECVTNRTGNGYPRIKFSMKEWKFVIKYGVDKGLLREPNSRDNTIDLSNVLKNPKYGESMVIECPVDIDGSNDTIDMVTSYQYNTDTDDCRFYMVYNEVKDYALEIIMDYTDMKNFNIADSLVEAQLNIIINPDGNIPSSMEALINSVPDQLLDIKPIMMLLSRFLSVHLVIYDRPQRSRMVREERRESRHRIPNKNSKDKSKSDVVITRILMPIKDAKEYVDRMTATAGEHPERNYILESWPRAGHWRRKPNSEERIWIDDTTCKRRKPLTDKEVVIKL